MKAISATGVHFTYDDGTEALSGIDFHVEEGEFIAILGSNGSGKTTLINLLVGLIKARAGRIMIGGQAIGELSAEELYQRVGLVFQNPNDQLFAATVEEDCAFGPRNLNLPEAEVQQRVTESLSAVAALPLRGRAIHHLSFGEQKRVSLAGVMAMRPSVLILDEPTAGLDPAGEAQMMQLLKKLNREEGLTVILATHSVDMLPLFANRIYVLDQGRVLQEGPSEEIFCHQEMIDRAKLRLPYISRLMYEMKRHDGVPIDGLPLTIGEAREQLLELIPKELIIAGMGEKRP
ncbi:MAG: ATP-binding cassette domain-containing protein [Proteobacteria bacterium]|nr:ATP-binding cassette domain-containing protein [Pseudomonadota bacterium]MBU2227081.1 ATP-binding cassette domain-containing protein [Pseudomonadota bacterium]MBU2262287.1 ATP-binding cassette domain-containing protein [Pseudomonadota bacterium]